ncbi:MAG: hypothetical protein M0024_07560 [Nitrospiraceae bacterium]|nr:hypothetical protein [Nitrospiraceae bacterium]
MKLYLLYGAIICALFFGAGLRGYVLSGITQSAKWGPQGHGMYHK